MGYPLALPAGIVPYPPLLDSEMSPLSHTCPVSRNEPGRDHIHAMLYLALAIIWHLRKASDPSSSAARPVLHFLSPSTHHIRRHPHLTFTRHRLPRLPTRSKARRGTQNHWDRYVPRKPVFTSI